MAGVTGGTPAECRQIYQCRQIYSQTCASVGEGGGRSRSFSGATGWSLRRTPRYTLWCGGPAPGGRAAARGRTSVGAEGGGGCRQQDQRELRRQRKRLRDACAGADGGEALLEVEDVEELCRELGREAITALCDAVEAAGEEDAKRAALEAALSQMFEARGEVRPALFLKFMFQVASSCDVCT